MINDFGYESPINIYYREFQTQVENEIMKAVTSVGVHVDKEELLKALRYDRGQYEKGYQDGLNANGWIPCSERLPEETDSEYYPAMHITTLKGIVEFGFYRCDAEQWYLYNEEMGEWKIVENEKIIAWQPLPAPYDMRKKVEE